MKFAIKPGSLIQMLEIAGEWGTRPRRVDEVLRLAVCQGRVCVESKGKASEAPAIIWEEGQCRLSRARLLQALKTQEQELELLIAGDQRGLQIAGTSVPVSGFSSHATFPSAFQMSLATDLGVVSRGIGQAA